MNRFGKILYKNTLKDGKQNLIIMANNKIYLMSSGKEQEKHIVKIIIQNILKIKINIQKYIKANNINRAQTLSYQMNLNLCVILVK